MPLSDTFCGVPGTLSAIISVSVLFPGDALDESNLTVTVQELPAARVDPHVLLVMLYVSPTICKVMLEKETVAVPVLVTVTTRLTGGSL